MKIPTLAAIFFAAITGAYAAEPIHALLLTGGCCHDYAVQKNIITEGISKRANVVWTIMWEGGSGADPKTVDKGHHMSIYSKDDWAKGYDVVVHDECFGEVTNDDFVNHIAKAHYDGVPAVVIHCMIHTYRKAHTDEWRKCLGVSSYMHERARKFEVINIDPDHPVMKGFPKTWMEPAPDELYHIVKEWPNCVPLAKGIGAKKDEHTCIWVNTYGKARVFGTTLGHGDVTVSTDTYLDLLTRGLLWACHKLNDDGTPADGYGPQTPASK